MTSVAAQLVAAGLSIAEAERKQRLFAGMERVMQPAAGARRWFVPGRIEVLGKHTDYAGGRSLLCATERGMCVMAQPREDGVVRVTDATRGASITLPLSSELVPPEGWGNYLGAVTRRLAKNFRASRGADISIASDLHSAAGMSSSSVLVVAIFTAVAAINRISELSDFRAESGTPEHLAEYLGCVENGQTYRSFTGDRGVGTFGGSEDHTAILCSQPGSLGCYRFCPVTLEQRVKLPEEWVFAIASSGVRAHKAGAALDLYNRASRTATALLDAWNSAAGRRDPSLGSVLRELPDAPGRIREALKDSPDGEFSREQLQARFEQFLLESEVIIPAAVQALAAGDLSRFGDLVDRSQAAAEQWLGNQVPETVSLAKAARRLSAIAASAFGAGFGGSVWALVRRSETTSFLHDWRAAYCAEFSRLANQCDFFTTGAGPGLTEL